jgi:hypothetical protein
VVGIGTNDARACDDVGDDEGGSNSSTNADVDVWNEDLVGPDAVQAARNLLISAVASRILPFSLSRTFQ